jgi:methionyl-tRNA formyltransferase
VSALEQLARGAGGATPQPAEGVTYAHKIGKGDACIDWTCTASEIDRQIRAFNPSPGAATRMHGADLKVWSAALLSTAEAPPGTIIRIDSAGIDVACGAGALRLLELQRAGGKRLPVDAFLRGHPLAPGDAFEPVSPIESSPRSPI